MEIKAIFVDPGNGEILQETYRRVINLAVCYFQRKTLKEFSGDVKKILTLEF